MDPRTTIPLRRLAFLALPMALFAFTDAPSGDKPTRPVMVKVEEEKATVVEAELPVDPVERIRYQHTGNFFLQINSETGGTLHLGHYPTFKIDGGMAVEPSGLGRFEKMNSPLPKTATGKARKGYMNALTIGDIHITQWVELAPTKSPAPGVKRQMDAVLVKYIIENKGKVPHSVGMRTFMDTYIINNDRCKFAAPNRPGMVLSGVEFKGKDVPDFIQMLQMPDLKNPGYVSHLTFNLGSGVARPDRVVLTMLGAARDNWDVAVFGGDGDSAMAFFYDPKEIKPGGKRELMYTYGKGQGSPVSAEGSFQFNLGGSFEVGKTFTISALIADPAPGQTLELDLPKGLERIEGRPVQPVPEAVGETGYSLVLWKGTVREYGRFPIRIKSNTGVTRTKVVTLAPG